MTDTADDSYDLLREYALLPVSTWAGGYVRPGKDARMQLIALLASVERLQSIEQMLREPGEDVIEEMVSAHDDVLEPIDWASGGGADKGGMKAAIAMLRKKAVA